MKFNFKFFGREKEIDDIKSRLSELEQKIEQLESLPQTVANLQAIVDKLPTGNQKPQQTAVQKPQQTAPQTVSQPAKPAEPSWEVHYIEQIDTSGNIEIGYKIPKSEALFELTTLGDTAELRPLTEQSAYLIMQQKYLLEPAFDVSGAGQRINCTAPAQYELQGNVWSVKNKGQINLA